MIPADAGREARHVLSLRPPRADPGTMTALPLAGIKVVEIAQNLAGPFAGEILARLGADVVKVERPDGGDDARGWGPPFLADLSPVFHAANTNKRSITLDLRDPAAVAWLVEYVEGADVLVHNLRPGVIEELGLGPETLLAKNPRLVYCSLWTFGTSGPLRLRPGYEPMVQAFAGLMMVNGEEGGPPMRMGTSVRSEEHTSELQSPCNLVCRLLLEKK